MLAQYSEEKLMITTPLSALRHAKWTYEQQFGNIRAIKLLLSIHYLEFNDQQQLAKEFSFHEELLTGWLARGGGGF